MNGTVVGHSTFGCDQGLGRNLTTENARSIFLRIVTPKDVHFELLNVEEFDYLIE